MLLMLNAVLVVLERVTACAALVELTVWLANVSEDGVKLAGGPVVEVPPLKAAKILPFQFEFA